MWEGEGLLEKNLGGEGGMGSDVVQAVLRKEEFKWDELTKLD